MNRRFLFASRARYASFAAVASRPPFCAAPRQFHTRQCCMAGTNAARIAHLYY
jgi:hypothetical protein